MSEVIKHVTEKHLFLNSSLFMKTINKIFLGNGILIAEKILQYTSLG